MTDAVGPARPRHPALCSRAQDLVARAPVWAYVVALGGTILASRLVDRFADAAARNVAHARPRARTHAAGVTAVIYMSGWGPEMGMAYAFAAFADLEQSGAATWRAALGWSLAGCAVGQTLVLFGWAPTFMSISHADGRSVSSARSCSRSSIRMAGMTGEAKEKVEALLAHQALHDGLTGLPNRQLLVDRLNHAIELMHRRSGPPPVVMFLDLNRFKLVNDTFGHQTGDELLKEVARRVRSVLRESDTLSTVAPICTRPRRS